MDYKEEYEKLKRFVTDLYPHMSDYCKEKVDGYFPEPKESEDERVRMEIIHFIKGIVISNITEEQRYMWLAWLEKQGEQKPTDTPTYNVGDFIHCTTINGFEYTYIYKKNWGTIIRTFAKYSYATSELSFNDDILDETIISTKRKATKEEIDTLLQAIYKQGYEWDAETKELRKIESKSTWSEEDEDALDIAK